MNHKIIGDISHWMLWRNSSRLVIDNGQTFGVQPLAILTKFQSGLLIKRIFGNILCKHCIKTVEAFGDGGWDLGCKIVLHEQ